MRVFPQGPVLGPTVHATQRIAQRVVKGARDLTAVELRCGILHRVHEIRKKSESTRPAAVVKAQASDVQANEITLGGSPPSSLLSGAFLERCPKGRWRKVQRQQTVLVENSPSTPFSDPMKSFSPRIQNRGAYVRRMGRLPQDRPGLRFVIHRNDTSLPSVLHRLQYEIGVGAEAIQWRTPPCGHLASVTQFGEVVGVTKELLAHASRHYNLHPLIFDPREYMTIEETAAKRTDPGYGFFYRLLLRCVEGDADRTISEGLKSLSAHGFVNYFGVDRFGIGDNTLFDIASLHNMGRLDLAVGSFLQMMAESIPLHREPFINYVKADDSTVAGIAKMWSERCRAARLPEPTCQLVSQLSHYASLRAPKGEEQRDDADSSKALEALWAAVWPQERFFESAAEFVWNAMASQRLINDGLRVVKGDVVACGSEFITASASDVAAGRYSIEDVVLPVPYRDSDLSNMRFPENDLSQKTFDDFAARHRLLSGKTPVNRDLVYRRIISKPYRLQASVIRDPSSLSCLKTDLFLLQERVASSESFDLSYCTRVREPTVFNVSERFRSFMSDIQQHNKGECSIALSFMLKDNASPFVMLREVFDLRYARCEDFYGF